MLKIRLQRVGRKNDPSFRVIVTDSRKGPKTGNYIEMLGSYNPRQKQVSVNGDRVKHWIGMGAQVSSTVNNILVNEKVLDRKKVNPLPKKTPIVKEATEDEAKASAEAVDNSPAETAPADSEKEADDPKEEAPAEDVKPARSEDHPGGEESKEEVKEEKEEDKKEA